MKKFFFSLAAFGLMAVAPLALAQAPADAMPADEVTMGAEADEGYASEAIFMAVEILNFVLVAVAIVILALVMGRHGKSELSVIFAHFMLGSALLGASRLFILMMDNGIVRLHDEAGHMGWHFIFYLSLITFILGARGLVHLATTGNSKVSQKEFGIWSAIALLLTAALFVMGQGFETWYMGLTAGGSWESFGAMHFIAFILSGVTAFYVFQRTRVGHITKVLATPMLVALGLFAGQHFWELLAESWGVVDLPGAVVEQIEFLFITPAFIALAVAYFRLWKLTSHS